MVLEAAPSEKMDEVDRILASKSGEIQRPVDPKFCRHNARQKCSHCLPLDPYDEEYLKEKEIKHMSFHAYVRKLTKGHGKGSHLKRPLENIRAEINLNCTDHKPFPKGICTKCKPPMITLDRQKYRHIDNITFENQELVNEFLNYWRLSGFQRFGYLIGSYQPFSEVPLGIKAVVAAIYEPPQSSSKDGVGFLDDPNEEAVEKLCYWLGLKKVGWIFTDLWSADTAKGSVHCTRHKDSFLLSAEECITAGYLQAKHKNMTEFCSDGHFGSKFVTVVASGDESENVNFHGYQVSNQCSAMVQAQIICPTNHPELAYIREEPMSEKQYIADVEYTEKNEYGAEVRKTGRPLPVEFLLVDVPTGVPKEPSYTFPVDPRVKFVIENRSAVNQHQTPDNLTEYCNAFSLNQFLEQATNFHFLIYLMTNPMVSFSDEELIELCTAVKTQERGKAMDWARNNENWQQLVTLCHVENSMGGAPTAGGSGPEQRWSCKHCTFENTEQRPDCSMCGLPIDLN